MSRRTNRVKRLSSTLPIVAIVGRPNVGKSTFFNRMTGGRRALTHNRPGVTRDRHYGEAEYMGRGFILIDTGGFEPDAAGDDVFRQVREQALVAVDEADVILVFFDGRQGIIAGDYDVVNLLRSYQKPTLFVVNKIDGAGQQDDVYDFYQLGIDAVYPISSEHARGVDDLLDALLELLPAPKPEEQDEDAPGLDGEGGEESGDREEAEALDNEESGNESVADDDSGEDYAVRIALVGRPNVGKSSLCNQIIGYERQVIHHEAGTTRDSIDVPFDVDGQSYLLIDTAGVRRKARISDKLEQFTVIKAFKALSAADVALLLIDATEGVTSQEQRLAGMIEEKGRGVAILINKWDLMEGRGENKRDFAEKVLRQLEHIRYAPVHFLSALTGAGVQGILPIVSRISTELQRELSTGELNKFLQEAIEAHTPPVYKNHPVKFFYAVQVKSRPPTFMFFVNSPEGVRPDYRRYLENQMRERFGFVGAPVHIVIRAKKR